LKKAKQGEGRSNKTHMIRMAFDCSGINDYSDSSRFGSFSDCDMKSNKGIYWGSQHADVKRIVHLSWAVLQEAFRINEQL